MVMFEDAVIYGLMVAAIVVALVALIYAVAGMIRHGIWGEAESAPQQSRVRRRRAA
jgi:hypothetical protein